MKKLITLVSLVTLSTLTFADSRTVFTSISKADSKIDVSTVASSFVAGANKEKDITVRVITTDRGGSTDVSPRYHTYLTFFHAGEMRNTRTAFDLGEMYRVNSVTRTAPGVYEISYQSHIDLKNHKMKVDTTQVFIDDKNLNLPEFADEYFKSAILVTDK